MLFFMWVTLPEHKWVTLGERRGTGEEEAKRGAKSEHQSGPNQVDKRKDVNAAAGEYDQYKREELSRDTFKEDEQPIEREFAKIREFCLNSANANCFLVDKDSPSVLTSRIGELTDLRLVHKVRSRVTISSRQGKLFEAYMLDVSQYTASRKKRELEIIEFWRPESTERLRRVSLIYAEAMAGRNKS